MVKIYKTEGLLIKSCATRLRFDFPACYNQIAHLCEPYKEEIIMLDQSYYRKTDEIIEHYGRKAGSLIPTMKPQEN